MKVLRQLNFADFAIFLDTKFKCREILLTQILSASSYAIIFKFYYIVNKCYLIMSRTEDIWGSFQNLWFFRFHVHQNTASPNKDNWLVLTTDLLQREIVNIKILPRWRQTFLVIFLWRNWSSVRTRVLDWAGHGTPLQASKLNFFPRSNSASRSKILGVNLV